MLSTGELLEIYKAEKTFRIATPETIDPGRTNPNAPFVITPVQDVGTSNQIVARVLLQSDQILNSALMATEAETNAIRKQLHQCKEWLLRCESLAKRINYKTDVIEQSVKQVGIPSEKGRVLSPFPQVEDLEADCGAFLVDANRAISRRFLDCLLCLLLWTEPTKTLTTCMLG